MTNKAPKPRIQVSAAQRITFWVMAVLILIPGGMGFGDKLYQFFVVLMHNPEGRFALVPIACYLLVSMGFVFVLIWASFKGMFSDIESPKYKMLDQEEALDNLEANAGRA